MLDYLSLNWFSSKKKKASVFTNTSIPNSKFIEAGLFVKCSSFDDAIGKEIIYVDDQGGSIRFLLSDRSLIKFNLLKDDPEYVTKFEFDEVLYFSGIISDVQFKKIKEQTEKKWTDTYVNMEKETLESLQKKYEK